MHHGKVTETHNVEALLKIHALAINEDNNEDQVFKSLETGKIRICYASPESLLQNNRFKQLFRSQSFRWRQIVTVIDEAHVIQQWQDDFCKDYGKLQTLCIIAGTEIPMAAFSATVPTHIFEMVYHSLGLGSARPFWGIDLGADQPNLMQVIHPMQYAAKTFAALFAFIPEDITPSSSPEQLPKMIFYFKSWWQAREVCEILHALLPHSLRECLYAFTGTNSEGFRVEAMALFELGIIRWLFATDAAGMGCDIPDIVTSVVYGLQDLCSAFQKGGRAGR